jgi:hypothetical protein
MAPKKQPVKPVKKVYDYSGLEKGMRLQAESDGQYYAAEVVQVSTAKNRAKAPVKVSYKGYEGYDEWVGGDRLRSKALKAEEPKKEVKEKKPKEKKERPAQQLKKEVKDEKEEIPIKRVARVYTVKVADEAGAIKMDAIANEAHKLLVDNKKEKSKGYMKFQRTVCKSEWAYEMSFVFDTFENFKAYDDSEWRKEALLPLVVKIKEIMTGELYSGVRVFDELR